MKKGPLAIKARKLWYVASFILNKGKFKTGEKQALTHINILYNVNIINVSLF